MATFPTSGLYRSTDTITGDGTAPYTHVYKPENVILGGGSLQLKVPGGQSASPINAGEIFTGDQDILYASVRTWWQISTVPGTCQGKCQPPRLPH